MVEVANPPQCTGWLGAFCFAYKTPNTRLALPKAATNAGLNKSPLYPCWVVLKPLPSDILGNQAGDLLVNVVAAVGRAIRVI